MFGPLVDAGWLREHINDDDLRVIDFRWYLFGRKGRDDFFEISSGDYLASGNLRGGQVRLRRSGCDDAPAE